MVDNFISFMDGVSFPVQCTDEWLAQNAMYCGYDCDTMVNNVFAYGPDGTVFFAAVNFPGSWADGSLTTRFLPYMKRKIGENKICVDQGFPRIGDAHGFDREYVRCENLHGYDRITQYYFRLEDYDSDVDGDEDSDN
jgi:hypothetical protein